MIVTRTAWNIKELGEFVYMNKGHHIQNNNATLCKTAHVYLINYTLDVCLRMEYMVL